MNMLVCHAFTCTYLKLVFIFRLYFMNFADSIKEVKVTKFTFDIDYYNTKGGRAILSIGDGTVRGTTGGSKKNTYSNTGAIFALGSDKSNALLNGASQTLTNYTDKWMHLTVTVDMENKTTDYKITDLNNNVIKEATGIAFYADNVTNCSQIDLFGYINYSKCAKIGKIEVKAEYKQVSFASYTIKYVDGNNNILKESRTGSGVVGDAVNITEADKQSFTTSDGGKKYIYESDDAENQTIAEDGSTIVTIKFREAEKYNYTVKTCMAGQKVSIATGTDFEGETVYVNYPQHYKVENSLYSIEKQAYNNDYYRYNFTIKSDNQVEEIDKYNLNMDNIVYYREAEKIDGLTASTAANSNIRCSNGKCAYNAGENDVVITTLPAGKYKLYTSTWGGHNEDDSKNVTFEFKAGENNVIHSTRTTGSTNPTTSKEFVISNETNITLGATTNANCGVDFIYIQKTGEAEEEVAVGDAGLATYTPSTDLDFTNATKIAAYKASVSGNEVTLTKVTTVAKEEGVLIRSINGGAVTENITVAATATKNEGNAFVGTLTDITVNETDGENTNYVLSKENDVMGFYKAKTEADGGTKVAAGKAYLPVATADAAKGIKVVFDGETTGISTVKGDNVKNNVIYNLNGQRVAAPAKGLYIMNGKKFIVK